MATSPHIDVRGVTHVYSNGRRALTALSGVDLTVARGEFVSVIGPSGGGKTTLLKAVGGLISPSSGEIQVGGYLPSEAQGLKLLGFVFQDPSLLPWRSVAANIALPMELAGQDRSRREEALGGLLGAVGLAGFADYYPGQLSGGMRQRVALARALAADPDVLLMDEPLGSLDEITREAMGYELLRIWELAKKTVLMVTHSIPEAVMLSDRVIVMSQRPGRVVDDIRIDLGRPRSEAMGRSREFLEYVYRTKETLSGQASWAGETAEAHA